MLKILFAMKLHVVAANIALACLLLVPFVAKSGKERLTKLFAVLAFVFMTVTAIVGGYWYVTYYPGIKKLIVAGNYGWTHKFFMEVKEHLFFQIYALVVTVALLSFSDIGTSGGKDLVIKVALSAVVLILLVNIFGHIVNIGAEIALTSGG